MSHINGEIKVSLSDRSFTHQGPMKMKMGGHTGQGGGQVRMKGNMSQGEKPLNEMVKDLGGEFEMIAPIKGEQTGMQFVATFKTQQE